MYDTIRVMDESDAVRPLSRRKETLLVLGVVGLAVVLLFPGVLFRGEELYLRDLSSLQPSMRTILLNAVRSAGWPPLWNEYLAGGQPLAANPHFGAFHPLALQFFILPWVVASALQVLIPIVGTYFGMYILLRHRSCGVAPAVLGAMSWAFGGLTLSLTNLLPMLWTLAPLPFAVAFADSAAAGWHGRLGEGSADRSRIPPLCSRPWSYLGLSASIAVIVIGGEPTSILICAIAVLPSVVWSLRAAPAAASRMILLSTALGLGVSACVLVPAVGLTMKTGRVNAPIYGLGHAWSLPPIRLTELVSPPAHLWPSTDDDGSGWYQRLYPSFKSPLLLSLYPGLLMAVLGVSGALTAPRNHLREIGLAAVAVVLAIGPASPVWPEISRIPLVRIGRYPEKWIVLACFCAVVMGSRALERFWHDSPKKRRTFAITSMCFAVVVAVGWAASLGAATGQAVDYHLRTSSALVLGTLSLMGVLMAGFRPRWRWGSALRAAILALALSDLVVCGRMLVPTRATDSSATMPSVFAPVLSQASEYRMFHLASLRSTPGEEPWMGPPPATARWGLRTLFDRDFDDTHLTWTYSSWKEYLGLMAERPDLTSSLLAQVGVASVVHLVGPNPRDPEEWGISLSPIADPAPIVSCVDAVSVVSSPLGWKKAVVELLDDAPGRVAVVERPLGPVPLQPDGCGVDSISTAPTHIAAHIRGHGPGPSVVRVNQTWDRGWKARIDGEPVELMRCGIAFAAVVMPAGKHVLELAYHDPLVTIGVVISVCSALVVMLWAGLLVRRAGR